MLNEGFISLKGADDVSIDVLEFSQKKDARVEAKEDPDATENSSSFADTISGNENNYGLSDAQVESPFFGDSDLAPPFDALGSVFPGRKKKLTAHWRNFIHPIMWRCKWTELRMKELESQASKYVREISINDRGKHMPLNQMSFQQFYSKSMPFTHRSRRTKTTKRRKRKRVEFTTDIASYMSNHILFAECENRRGDLDGIPTWDNIGTNSDHPPTGRDDFEIHDDCLFPEDNNNDDSFLEHVLGKIELLHTRVNKLKDNLNSVMPKNATIFSSSENLNQFVHSPTFSACNGGLYTSSPRHYDVGDYCRVGEAIPIPDIIESTVGLLSSIDVTQHHHHHVGDSSERIVDNMLNEGEEIEGSTLKKTQEAAENSGEEEECNNNNAMLLTLEADVTVSKDVFATTEHSILKSCLSSEIHFPKNKRKRGERKAGSSNWSRQRPGEPDC